MQNYLAEKRIICNFAANSCINILLLGKEITNEN